jgi:cell filamentation protein
VSEQDPYCYPGSNVLRNLFDLRTQAELSKAEADITFLRLGQLERIPAIGKFDLDHLREIHRRIFRDVYPWAGQLRTVSMSKGESLFCRHEFIAVEGERIFTQLHGENMLRAMSRDLFCERLAFYFGEINALHPFREGNGRTQRVFLESIAKQAGYDLDFKPVSRETMGKISRAAQVGRLEEATDCFKKVVSPAPARTLGTEKGRGKSQDQGR